MCTQFSALLVCYFSICRFPPVFLLRLWLVVPNCHFVCFLIGVCKNLNIDLYSCKLGLISVLKCCLFSFYCTIWIASNGTCPVSNFNTGYLDRKGFGEISAAGGSGWGGGGGGRISLNCYSRQEDVKVTVHGLCWSYLFLAHSTNLQYFNC